MSTLYPPGKIPADAMHASRIFLQRCIESSSVLCLAPLLIFRNTISSTSSNLQTSSNNNLSRDSHLVIGINKSHMATKCCRYGMFGSCFF